jgi:hypothetical protein
MGNILEVSSALYLDEAIVDKLLHFEIINGDNSEETIKKLALLALALQDCARDLRDGSFNHQKPFSVSLHDKETWLLPDPTLGPSLKPVSNLRFTSRLVRGNKSPHDGVKKTRMRPLFVAERDEGGAKQEVVVKFVTRYNEVAHQILAKNKLAPQLYEYYDYGHVVGWRKMVVMERVKGQPMSECEEGSLPRSVFDNIRTAVKLLKENRFVFGDLRATNVMVIPPDRTKGEREPQAVLVDFDWVDTDGRGTYPPHTNVDLTGVEWHKDVMPRKKMRHEHDDYAYDTLFEKYCKKA